MSVGIGWYRGGLELEDHGRAVGIEIDRGGAAVLIAEDGGAETETETRRVAGGVGTDVGVEGAVGAQKSRAGVGDKDLDHLALAGCLKANALG